MARNHKIDAHAVLERAKSIGAALHVTRGEAAALLDLLQCGDRTADSYQRRKTLATQMDRASGTRTRRARLPPLLRRADGQVRIGELARWASLAFKLPLDELPRDPPQVVNLGASGCVAAFADEVDAGVYPGDAKKCHEIMKALEQENARLRAELESYEERRIRRLVARFRKK